MKKCVLPFVLLGFILSFFVFFGHAQDIEPPKNIQSPNAASLGKYGDVPVSYYTGTPNISIPLYQLNDYGIPLNISLNYDASGVRVNSMPGWVGQNWSLQAGGVITRMVKNIPDEVYLRPHKDFGNTDIMGYFYPDIHELLNVNNWNTKQFVLNTLPNKIDKVIKNAGAFNIGMEHQPDIFTFNFMGHSGKFFLGADGKWCVSSSSNLKVIIEQKDFRYPFGKSYVPFELSGPRDVTSTVDSYKMIYKITLIDAQGNTYIFGNTATSIEYSIDFYKQNPHSQTPGTPGGADIKKWFNTGRWTANAWYLSEVQDRLGNTVYRFNYDREDYIPSFFRYKRVSASSFRNTLSQDSDLKGWYKHGGSLISPVYLNSISSLRGHISFKRVQSKGKNYTDDSNIYEQLAGAAYEYAGNPVYAHRYADPYYYYYIRPYSTRDRQAGLEALKKRLNNWKKLIAISGLKKEIVFSYNDSSSHTSDNHRLALMGVKVNDKHYAFSYNDIEKLPDYLSAEVDHWGYFNGLNWDNLQHKKKGREQTAHSKDKANVLPDDEAAAKEVSEQHKAKKAEEDISYYKSRQTHPDYVKLGMLTRITYPTGGYSEFDWEANSYSAYVSDDKSRLIGTSNIAAGGVRIKQITNNSVEGTLVREFRYVKNYASDKQSTVSSGIIENKPRYEWDNFKLYDTTNREIFYSYLFSTNPILPLSNYMGSHIGYSEVVEIFTGSGGFKIHQFTSNANFFYRDERVQSGIRKDISPYTDFSDKSLLRGKPTQITAYNAAGQALKRQKQSYSFFHENTTYVKSLKIMLTTAFGGYYLFVLIIPQKIYYFDHSLVSEENITYMDGGKQMRQSTSYDWKAYQSTGHQFLNAKTTYTDKGNFKETYYYPFDMKHYIHDRMINKHHFPVLKTEVYRLSGKASKLISRRQVEYAYVGSKILPKRVLSAKGNHGWEEKLVFDSYTADGLPSKYHTANGIYTTLSYKNRLPVFKVEGSGDISGDSFFKDKLKKIRDLSDMNAIISRQQEVRSRFPDFQITSYTHDPILGPTSITDPTGNTLYYEYDTLNRLKHIRDKSNNILNKYEYHYKPQN